MPQHNGVREVRGTNGMGGGVVTNVSVCAAMPDSAQRSRQV